MSGQQRRYVEFKNVVSLPFCEKVGKRYAIEITTVDGAPYVNMAAYNADVQKQEWVRDFKKNYFMPADVFMILFAKWGNVSKVIHQELQKCMLPPK